MRQLNTKFMNALEDTESTLKSTNCAKEIYLIYLKFVHVKYNINPLVGKIIKNKRRIVVADP